MFRLASDFPRAAGRIPDITKIEMLTPEPVGVGTKFKETRKMFGKEATETMEVAEFDPPRSYKLHANSCGTIYEFRMTFTPEGNGTRLAASFTATPVSFWARIMLPMMYMMSGVMKKCLLGDMNAIRTAAEQTAH